VKVSVFVEEMQRNWGTGLRRALSGYDTVHILFYRFSFLACPL